MRILIILLATLSGLCSAPYDIIKDFDLSYTESRIRKKLDDENIEYRWAANRKDSGVLVIHEIKMYSGTASAFLSFDRKKETLRSIELYFDVENNPTILFKLFYRIRKHLQGLEGKKNIYQTVVLGDTDLFSENEYLETATDRVIYSVTKDEICYSLILDIGKYRETGQASNLTLEIQKIIIPPIEPENLNKSTYAPTNNGDCIK